MRHSENRSRICASAEAKSPSMTFWRASFMPSSTDLVKSTKPGRNLLFTMLSSTKLSSDCMRCRMSAVRSLVASALLVVLSEACMTGALWLAHARSTSMLSTCEVPWPVFSADFIMRRALSMSTRLAVSSLSCACCLSLSYSRRRWASGLRFSRRSVMLCSNSDIIPSIWASDEACETRSSIALQPDAYPGSRPVDEAIWTVLDMREDMSMTSFMRSISSLIPSMSATEPAPDSLPSSASHEGLMSASISPSCAPSGRNLSTPSSWRSSMAASWSRSTPGFDSRSAPSEVRSARTSRRRSHSELTSLYSAESLRETTSR